MKRFLKVLPVILMVVLVFSGNVFADYISTNVNTDGNNKTVGSITGLAYAGWNTVIVIIQILSLIAIMFAGLRYMFTSASQKAEIKKSLGILAVGAMLVFATSTIIGVIVKVAEQAGSIATN